MANILDIKQGLSQKIRSRRREGKISQAELAGRSGVSLGSIKRFENSGEISLTSLLRIAVVLGYENDFDRLFERKNYQSIDEIIGMKNK
ncbi:MAG: helix-turn-helix domain-containing protein [Treponema sp.]|nr:helix-turn-helix domain-containing protein [Treponema sp.]